MTLRITNLLADAVVSGQRCQLPGALAQCVGQRQQDDPVSILLTPFRPKCAQTNPTFHANMSDS
jgi:hypothetical protein